MISETFEQRLQYYARLKAKLDEEWRLNRAARIAEQGWKDGMEAGQEAGRAFGLQEGLQEGLRQGREAGIQEGLQVGRDVGIREGHEAGLSAGIMIGRIQLLQQLLGIPVTQVEEFIGWDEDRLSSVQADLQSRLNR